MASALVGPAPIGSRWVDFGDAGRPLSWYQQCAAAGYYGAILDCITPGTDQDCANARQAGLAVMTFQGYWTPAFSDSNAAASRGQQAVQWAQAVGYPPGAVIWLDWEAVPTAGTAAIAWVNAWAQAVQAGGYTPGLYVGAPQPFDGQTLYTALVVQHYWRSCSQVPDVAVRGYQLVQVSCSLTIAGHAVDVDVVTSDHLGGVPLCWLPDPAADATTQRLAALEKQVAAIQAALRQAGTVTG